jgi:short-subunit dehydrogenase involved in D-alanine esterification of teichoic acids
MEAWNKFGEVKDESEGMDVFINCAGISLEKDFKGKFESLRASESERKKGDFLSTEFKEYLEDTLDLDTIYKILDVCGGLKLNQDPKALQEAMNLVDEAGKN